MGLHSANLFLSFFQIRPIFVSASNLPNLTRWTDVNRRSFEGKRFDRGFETLDVDREKVVSSDKKKERKKGGRERESRGGWRSKRDGERGDN